MDASVLVLLLEDDADSRALFREIFTDSGIDSITADHEELPEPDGFTLIVSDLPFGKRCYSSELASDWVRLLRQRYGVPVVILTGRSEAQRDQALHCLARYVLTKPIDITDFIAAIRAADGAGSAARN